MKATLRDARPADFPAVKELLTISELPLDGVPDTLEQFVVAEAGGEIVGVAGLETCCDDALLRSVAVDAEWRSKGVGRALVTRAIASAESKGFRALYLLTTTAEHYFPSFGFHEVDRASVPKSIAESVEFTNACPASAVAMERELAHP